MLNTYRQWTLEISTLSGQRKNASIERVRLFGGGSVFMLDSLSSFICDSTRFSSKIRRKITLKMK